MEVKEKKDNRKAYTLTATGEDLVADILDNKES
jgi:predicted transcriptional regulator